MAISTYSELRQAVRDWYSRSDLTDALISNFVILAESDLSADIDTKALETAQTLTVTSGNAFVSIPNNVLEIVSLQYVGATRPDIEVSSIERLQELRESSATPGRSYAAVVGRQLWLYPTPASSGQITLRARCSIPGLEANGPNWVLTQFPGAYLFATLKQAAAYLEDLSNEARFGASRDAIVAKINGQTIYRGQMARSVVRGTVR